MGHSFRNHFIQESRLSEFPLRSDVLTLRVSPAAQTFVLITAGATTSAYGRDYLVCGEGIGALLVGAWEGLRRIEAEAVGVGPFAGKSPRRWQ